MELEGEDLNCLYRIIESSSHFQPPLNSGHGFFSPQNCFIPSYQNSDIITNPQNGAVENLNVNSEKRGKRKQKKSQEKVTWYKGPWTKTEDRKLCRLVLHYGRGQWASIAQHMSGRIGKQCRERYHNNLFPDIKKSRVWSEEEELMIIEGHKKFGNRWSAIAKFLPGRSENAVKNHWNSIKRRQNSSKQIARPLALHESKLLENYIKNNYFSSHESETMAPPAFTITIGTRSFSAAIAPRPTTIVCDTLMEMDPPLSVDDYDTGGVPYFTFESAIDENLDLMPPYLNAIDEDLDSVHNIHSGDGGIHPSPFTGDADGAALMPYFAAETEVDEEMGFLRCLFGSNGEMLF